MRRPVIAGNWKMNKTIGEALDYVRLLRPLVLGATHCDIVIAPPFTAIRAVADRTEGSNIAIAAQDIAAETAPGAFTGEVSAGMLSEAGAKFAIVGHSERRQLYGETDESAGRKVHAALSGGLCPILCVGEQLEERDRGEAESRVERQLAGGLANLTPSEASRIIAAYEPVWAIGAGRAATPETAQSMHSFIRSRLAAMFGQSIAEGIRILYGGSVKPDNIAALMVHDDIDGVLAGGSSLDPNSFAELVNFRNRS